MFSFSRVPGAGYAAIAIVGLLFCAYVRADYVNDIGTAKARYKEAAGSKATLASHNVQRSLQSIYENLRTLTLLPSVRAIDRHASNLGADGRETIQQIYNNLANSVAVSEVYIVPATLDPDKVDAATGKPEEPIIMFDQLIVHAGASLKSKSKASDGDYGGPGEVEPEEVELFEYRQLRDQMLWLGLHYPRVIGESGLNIPVLSGPEIITCDNTHYIKSRLDADRSGIIFSVPFYGPDGSLRGTVSAIIRSGALRDLLPSSDYALVNVGHGYVTAPSVAGQEKRSREWVSAGKPDPKLIYSEVLPLSLDDPQGQWVIWVGHPDGDFFDSAEADGIKTFQSLGYAVTVILTLAGIAGWALVQRNLRLSRSVSSELERRVCERTAEIHFLATHDALTGLSNRVLLAERMDGHLRTTIDGELVAVLCVDLDHFKAVNDTLGHPIGDRLLRDVTARLRGCIGDHDTVARIGGDEFVIVRPGIARADEADILGRAIIEAVSLPFDLDGHQIVIGASVGIALAPSDGSDSDTLLRSADMALYRAKAEGRNALKFFESAMDARLQERRLLEGDLRRALAAREFRLVYQPVVDATTEQVIACEALLRWEHPERGTISPATFIPLAEETGLIVPIGEWVIQQACRDASGWPQNVRVAVNLSPVQFKSRALTSSIIAALSRSGLAPSRFELEITETALIVDNAATIAILHQLRALGIRIAMDDFGTGYSSLSYLRSFPFDKIKIDRSFVKEVTETADCLAIIKAVAGLGISLGIETTAEGVETAEQLKAVRDEGCTQVQGFYFSRPFPNHEIADRFWPREAKVA